jgi:hypothetical protein
MIIDDLENGIDRTGIREKYNLQAWEVKQMFEHPTLKGKKAKKVKKLSFEFVDDTTDPNQLDLEDQIKEEENSNIPHPELLDVDTYNEDKMHDAMVDHAEVKSNPDHMNEEELTDFEQEEEENENNY